MDRFLLKVLFLSPIFHVLIVWMSHHPLTIQSKRLPID
ncbi:hypothetical protein EV13_2746 [Prochlorococcus sp. MIT 0702]|nr:hypothetical protein EV12_2696 [Prochlorococcus sp. MIT 0701]KGG25972.1 hypothetical protein EV13_2746 [Prochlorococcus sp. MIT 0702]KGG30850.1 hypothetical protein EV14_2789 [Prochlorococcus sp. MIT 0703]